MTDKVKLHQNICEDLNNIYGVKNKRYNDSFSKSYSEYGLTMSCIRLDDKLSRFLALAKNKELDDQKDESIKDTLKDLQQLHLSSVTNHTKPLSNKGL